MTQVLEIVEVHEELRIKHSVCHSCVDISHWDHSTLFSGDDGPRGEGMRLRPGLPGIVMKAMSCE